MAAFDPATLDRWRALAIVDRDGTTVGTISEFYLDRETGYPTWALVNTGLFGATQTFVPLVHATEIADGLQVPYEKRHIKDSPLVDLHDELSPDEEASLFAHYGVDYEPSTEAPGAVDEGQGSGEPPGPVAVDPGAVDEGSGAVPAEPGSVGSAEAPGHGEVPGSVTAEPGPVGPAETVEGEGGSAPVDASEAVHVEHEPGEADGGYAHDPDTVTAGVPDEPGTAEPDDVTRVDPDGTRSEGIEQDEGPSGPDPDQFRSAPVDPDLGAGPDPDRLQSAPTDPALDPGPGPDRLQSAPADSDLDPGPGPDGLQTEPDDPDLGRTAPVEPGLPGSTAAAPYGPPSTVDKGSHPSELPPDEPTTRAPDEAAWAPSAAGSFEDHQPVDPPPGASDRWREAKLAAERDRVARAAAAQPEDRSPLERARRRLERLVGVGQDPADHDDVSPADRDAAERARRARLGFDEEDRTR